jgi:hypothetical protein
VKGQARRLQRDEFFQRHLNHRRTPVIVGYGTRYGEALGLDLDYLPMWLASIETNRVRVDVREKLIRKK